MKVIIIGGAAGSKIAQDIFMRNNVPIEGFMNNYVPRAYRHHLLAPILGDYHNMKTIKILFDPNIAYFVATGNNKMREEITAELFNATGKTPVNAIHCDVTISPTAKIGYGNLIMPGVRINAQARIGNGTIINTGAIVEHDCHVGDFAQLSPNATLGGYVTVKERAYVGLGANILPHVTIGENAEVGAGAVVLEDVNPATVVVGVPAKYKRDVK